MKTKVAETSPLWDDGPMIPIISVPSSIPNVPFYSQFQDISATSWQKKGCGIASLAMVIDYYQPEAVSVDKLLLKAIAFGAYQTNAGWVHKDLVLLAKQYGLTGQSYDLSKLDRANAFDKFKKSVASGPVIASVHYKFDPKSTIPHLVVIDGITDGVVYYNDPASKSGQKQISVEDFLKAWKKRYIEIRPGEVV